MRRMCGHRCCRGGAIELGHMRGNYFLLPSLQTTYSEGKMQRARDTHILKIVKNVLGNAVLVKLGLYVRNHVVDDGAIDRGLTKGGRHSHYMREETCAVRSSPLFYWT